MTTEPLNPPPAPPPSNSVPDFKVTKYEAVAGLLNQMDTIELKLFGEKHGFEIRHALAKTPKYKEMSPTEKLAFEQYHGLSGMK